MRSTHLLWITWLAACTSDPQHSPPDLSRAPADLATARSADLALAPARDLAETDQGASVDDALAARVIGAWATRARTSVTQTLPIVGNSASTTVTLALVEIARDGAGLTVTERGCHARVESTSMLATTTIPDAVPRSVGPVSAPFHVWDESGQTRWHRPATAIAVGVKLQDPEHDALPTSAADPRVWDEDGDGQPGVTVKVSGFASGDIYLVQRQRAEQSGTVGTRLTGTLADSSEQSVIGASNATLNQNIPSTPDPDPSHNTVEYVRLSTAYTCDQLVAAEATLF